MIYTERFENPDFQWGQEIRLKIITIHHSALYAFNAVDIDAKYKNTAKRKRCRILLPLNITLLTWTVYVSTL